MTPDPKLRRSFLTGLGLLLALVILGLWLIFKYLDVERQRDLDDWAARLGLVADERAAAVDRWLAARIAGLEELAGNASLQLYLSQLTLAAQGARTSVEPAQLGYLRNLILASAERQGFTETDATPRIPANMAGRRSRGLLLADRDGRILVATPDIAPLHDADQIAIQEALASGRRTLTGIHLDQRGRALIGFAVPVFAVQGLEETRPVGALLGIRNASDELFPLLGGNEILGAPGETLLVARQGRFVQYLSPLADGTPPGKKRLAIDTPGLAAAHAVRTPTVFMQARDYRGRAVLSTSRLLDEAPWILVQNVEEGPALAEARRHRRTLLTVFLLTLTVVAVALVAAWQHGASQRARALAEERLRQSRALETKSRLLHAVIDTLEDFVFLLDGEGRFLFANRALATHAGMEVTDFRGKPLAAVLGPVAAETLRKHFEQGHSNVVLRLELGGREHRFQCAIRAVPDQSGIENATLVVLHDITELQEAQARHQRLLEQTIGALMAAVDKHDPCSADHSRRTARVARAIGEAMELPPDQLETLELAALLANVGKIFVPPEILAKTDPLTPEEENILRQHVQYSLDILSGLEFEGPVLETIAQKQEHLDGSGYPRGLRNGEIILTARILAVANAFVALVSPRAWREARSPRAAVDELLKEAGSRYDRQVVAALFNLVENEPGEVTVRSEE